MQQEQQHAGQPDDDDRGTAFRFLRNIIATARNSSSSRLSGLARSSMSYSRQRGSMDNVVAAAADLHQSLATMPEGGPQAGGGSSGEKGGAAASHPLHPARGGRGAVVLRRALSAFACCFRSD